MTGDELLSGAELDAFVVGATDENGMRRDGELGERARRLMRTLTTMEEQA